MRTMGQSLLRSFRHFGRETKNKTHTRNAHETYLLQIPVAQALHVASTQSANQKRGLKLDGAHQKRPSTDNAETSPFLVHTAETPSVNSNKRFHSLVQEL